jgi:hypothetical protein
MKFEKNVACLHEDCESPIARQGDVWAVINASGEAFEVPGPGLIMGPSTFVITCSKKHEQRVIKDKEVSTFAVADDDTIDGPVAVALG